jgi:hypothetical protein
MVFQDGLRKNTKILIQDARLWADILTRTSQTQSGSFILSTVIFGSSVAD